MVRMLLTKGRRESSLIIPHPAPLTRKAGLLMRHLIVLVSTMALTLLVVSGVALAATIHCPNVPPSGVPATLLFCNGTSEADTMYGSDLADYMFGMGGRDTMHAYGSSDSMEGGKGSDHIYGDAGGDETLWGGDYAGGTYPETSDD